jgi:DNA-binding LacI/PurR family transcriptional regulator
MPKSKGRVGIRDVAREAAVSIATVSNALNGTGRVSPATREHVRNVAAALGYRPGSAPVRRRAGATQVLGLTVTTFGERVWNFARVEYFAQAIATATAAAHERGYALTVLPTALSSQDWRTMSVDGVLLLYSPADDPVVHILRARGIPIAFDGQPEVTWPGEMWVDNDHFAAGRTVLDHLETQGAKRVALMAGPADDHYTRVWIAAYWEWCAERGQPPLLARVDRSDAGGFTAAGALLSAVEPLDAICSTYEFGLGVLRAARRHGLRVPEDLMVVCVSEDPSYAWTNPPISTLSLSPRISITRAVDGLVDLIENRIAPVPRPVPTRLIVRASTMRTPIEAQRAETERQIRLSFRSTCGYARAYPQVRHQRGALTSRQRCRLSGGRRRPGRRR